MIRRNKIYKHSKLRWVYIILIKKEMVYIGSSQDPLRRFKNHTSTIWMKYLRGKIENRIYGPFESSTAYMLEREAIRRFGNELNLLNKNHGKAIKKSRQKAEKLERQSSIERGLFDEPGMVVNY
jgi:predicted GIY-YIG superfamily endonuclease